MKTTHVMRKPAPIIRIPEPCHEAWDNMKPCNQGRFCSSCEKTVVDFTGKTDLEIQAYLRGNAGKRTCGRFKTQQINRPLSGPVLSETKRNSRPHLAFVAALLLVFGVTLFSCYDPSNKTRHQKTDEPHVTLGMVISEPIVSDPEEIYKEPVETAYDNSLCQDQSSALIHVEPCSESISCQTLSHDTAAKTISELEVITTGELEYDFIEAELGPPTAEPTDTVNATILLPVEREPSVPEDSKSESFGLVVYPNPGDGQFFVKYTVGKPADVQLDLLDLQGRLLRPLVAIKNQHHGEYQIPFDLSDNKPDLYLLRLRIGELEVTKRVVVQR